MKQLTGETSKEVESVPLDGFFCVETSLILNLSRGPDSTLLDLSGLLSMHP